MKDLCFQFNKLEKENQSKIKLSRRKEIRSRNQSREIKQNTKEN